MVHLGDGDLAARTLRRIIQIPNAATVTTRTTFTIAVYERVGDKDAPLRQCSAMASDK